VSIFRLLLRGFFIPPLYKESLRIPLNTPMHGFWRTLYAACLADSRRSYIEEDELCSFTWSFRFKKSAGRTWLALDPWWQGTGAALQLRFNRDRTVEHIGRSLLGSPSPEFRWKFQQASGSRHPTLRGKRPLGSFIRMVAPWGEFPTLVVRRAPLNWGFVLESCWALYTSFPLPKRGENRDLEDESMVTGEMQEEDIEHYNGDDDEEDDEEEEVQDDEEASSDGTPERSYRLTA
ncbi:unnamed protein product, partial [Symbiodinium sp. KB8]